MVFNGFPSSQQLKCILFFFYDFWFSILSSQRILSAPTTSRTAFHKIFADNHEKKVATEFFCEEEKFQMNNTILEKGIL